MPVEGYRYIVWKLFCALDLFDKIITKFDHLVECTLNIMGKSQDCYYIFKKQNKTKQQQQNKGKQNTRDKIKSHKMEILFGGVCP